MKSILVVPSTSSNLVLINENCQSLIKENLNCAAVETLTPIEATAIENNLFVKTNNHTTTITTTTVTILSNSNSTISNDASNNADFQKLKRSHAIQDIQAMDDYSPVTYETSISSNCDFILEEDKIVIQGIKIRAAKIPKLILILIDSFGMKFDSRMFQLADFQFLYFRLQWENPTRHRFPTCFLSYA